MMARGPRGSGRPEGAPDWAMSLISLWLVLVRAQSAGKTQSERALGKCGQDHDRPATVFHGGFQGVRDSVRKPLPGEGQLSLTALLEAGL